MKTLEWKGEAANLLRAVLDKCTERSRIDCLNSWLAAAEERGYQRGLEAAAIALRAMEGDGEPDAETLEWAIEAVRALAEPGRAGGGT